MQRFQPLFLILGVKLPCYYIEENHKKEFADLIEQYGGGDCFGDIQPEIPDFEALETS